MIEKEIIQKKSHKPITCLKCVRVFSENELQDDSYVEAISQKRPIFLPCVSTIDICTKADLAMKYFDNQSQNYADIFAKTLELLDFDEHSQDFTHKIYN